MLLGSALKRFSFFALSQRIKQQLQGNAVWMLLLYIALICALWGAYPLPQVPIMAGALPFVALVFFYYPVLIGLAFISFSFFRVHEALPFLLPYKLPLLASILTLGAVVWHVLISKKITPYTSRELNAFALFFLVVTIGVPQAGNVHVAIFYYYEVYLKIGLMTLVLAWMMADAKQHHHALTMIVTSGAAIALVAIYNKINGIGLVELTRVTIGRHIGSVLGDPNDLSLVLLFPLSFAVSVGLTKGAHPALRAANLLIALLILLAIFETQSRGALLGICAVFVVFTWRRVPSKMAFLFFSIIALFALYHFSGIDERVSGGIQEYLSMKKISLDQAAKGRLYAWMAAFGMAMDHPFAGVGLNNYYLNYFYHTPYWDGVNHAVHSTWFGVMAETGFIGLAVFLLMYGVLFFSVRKSAKAVLQAPHIYSATTRALIEGLWSSVIAFLVSGTFLTQGFTWPLYILIAFAASVSRYVAKQNASTA
ncbi:MAG: O-antigen ligase family protein [Vibrionaceae bacterium]